MQNTDTAPSTLSPSTRRRGIIAVAAALSFTTLGACATEVSSTSDTGPVETAVPDEPLDTGPVALGAAGDPFDGGVRADEPADPDDVEATDDDEELDPGAGEIVVGGGASTTPDEGDVHDPQVEPFTPTDPSTVGDDPCSVAGALGASIALVGVGESGDGVPSQDLISLGTDLDGVRVDLVNCGESDVDVKVSTSNELTSDRSVLSIGPGVVQGFVLSADVAELDAGAFSGRVKLEEVGLGSRYVDVTGFQRGIDPDLRPDDIGLTAGSDCSTRCIRTVLVSPVGLASDAYDLEVATSSTADIAVFLSLAPIQRRDDGTYVAPTSEPDVSQPSTNSLRHRFDLQPDTEYHVLVRATDSQGTAAFAGSFTTSALSRSGSGFDTLSPCAAGCIESVNPESDGEPTRLWIHARTTSTATLSMAWSPEPFEWVDGSPRLDEGTRLGRVLDEDTAWSEAIESLEPSTTYSVMVFATDAKGGTDVWYARLRTADPAPPPPLFIGIDRVHIVADGDRDGLFKNQGEIRMVWGEMGQVFAWGRRNEARIGSGTTVDLHDENFSWVTLDDDGLTPYLYMYVGERDGGKSCFVEAGYGWVPDREFDESGTCRDGRRGLKWSYMPIPRMTMEEIRELDDCEGYGVERESADRCFKVWGASQGSDYVTFEMIVWYEFE